MIERRSRRRRDGTDYSVWRVRWRDEARRERSPTFYRARDARAYEGKIRTLKRSGDLADLDVRLPPRWRISCASAQGR